MVAVMNAVTLVVVMVTLKMDRAVTVKASVVKLMAEVVKVIPGVAKQIVPMTVLFPHPPHPLPWV